MFIVYIYIVSIVIVGDLMASNIFSELIIFVSVLIIAAAVSGILATTTHELSLGISSKGNILSSKLTQDFEIINDPDNIPWNQTTGEISIYIKNIGESPISFNEDVLTVIIDGNVANISSTSIVNGDGVSDIIYPSMVGKLNVKYNISGYHTIKVISEYGIIRTLKANIQ